MRKIQSLASVQSVEIPDALMEWNEENESERARLSFVYAATTTSVDDGEDEEARLLLGEIAGGQRYSIMIDLAPIEGKDTETKRANLEKKLKGKKVMFTTYVCEVSALLENIDKYDGVTRVNNGSRDYSTLSESYLGKNDDENGVFETLRNRLLKQLDDGDLETGSIADKKSNKRKWPMWGECEQWMLLVPRFF